MQTRFVPSGAVAVKPKGVEAVAYLYEAGKRIAVIGYAKKQRKAAIHYTFKTNEDREKAVKRFFEGVAASEKAKAERRQARKATGRGLEVGDILVASWGYEQTNIDFYQVVGLVGSKSVSIRKIAQETVETTGWASETVKAVKDAFIGEAFTKRATDGAVKFASYKYGFKWDGQARYQSHYA